MQQASKEYIESIKKPQRNRGYIKVTIGVVNSNAQNSAVLDEKTNLAYYADGNKIFDGYTVSKVYATAEQNFAKVDGTMYFLPGPEEQYTFYNNGLVTDQLLGDVYISFPGAAGLDIKGLTINFGEYYPTEFTIETDEGIQSYTNDKQLFVTEDAFDGITYIIIHPISLVNGQGRLRIYNMTMGIANTFMNDKVMNCSIKDYISPITETIPSKDISVTIENQDLYYSPDNPESAIAYMEIGQEMKVAFGYDVSGNGNIEWLPETTGYLNTWTANDVQAKFTATDRFYQLDDIFYGGLYRPDGITLYDLALEVLHSAGINDERKYYLDSYLKKIIVYNPIPDVKHSEALQIIANAGRCVLYEDRQNKIHMRSAFVPDMTATVNNKTDYSSIKNLLKSNKKDAYAIASKDFSVVDGSLFFMADDGDYKETGYVSNSIANANGDFEENPVITITLESGFDVFGLIINFRNVAPQEFVIRTYYEDVIVDTITVQNPELNFISERQFMQFNKMEIEFTKGHPDARITVDNILINDVTDYRLTRTMDLQSNPTGIRQEKIKTISVKKTNYRKSQEGFRELFSEKITLTQDMEHTVYFSIPSYGFKASIKDNSTISVQILESSNYFVKVKFSKVTKQTEIELVIEGYEYVADETFLKVNHNVNGQEIQWSNPLISTENHAKDLEEWIASYYLGDVEYDLSWRGDPRTDANDLFYLELKDREDALIRNYENTLNYNGAWSGNMKARKVAMSWQ
ncbi:hypothetical protein OCV51_10385 [Faecalicatena acetigenes]|uniref:Uncharacterized protein n=1 Tax=Faecalicatena acetigenes TaxID=2981790 RepID=A0ABT2TCP2_9FIRM|nr:hypothetical protein [Faecalicatena acetigenes]MCU6748053.1 hypothetical protein [Faecalicatena acetigenes]SCI23428.1 Uncharacterised protein [uncultured Clostridium sp.]